MMPPTTDWRVTRVLRFFLAVAALTMIVVSAAGWGAQALVSRAHPSPDPGVWSRAAGVVLGGLFLAFAVVPVSAPKAKRPGHEPGRIWRLLTTPIRIRRSSTRV